MDINELNEKSILNVDPNLLEFAKTFPDQFKLIMENMIENEKTKQQTLIKEGEFKTIELEIKKIDFEKYKLDVDKYKFDAQNKFELEKKRIDENIEKERTAQARWASICSGIADISISAMNKQTNF